MGGGGEDAPGTIYHGPRREERTEGAGEGDRGGLRSIPGRREQRRGRAKGKGEARGAEAGETHRRVRLEGPEPRSGQRRGAEPHLILRVLKHVAHTALIFLKAEEDVPQPQGGHEDHEGVKRQVPETDRVV